MKITVDWLRDFVDVDLAPDALAERLTLAGLEVESVEPVAADLAGVVVAEILERRAHPNADRLSLCRVSDGTRELEVVCGAANAAAGLKVPLAPVGTVLPGGVRIESAKIRGVGSAGMLCSARELGLSEDAAGLLELDAAAKPGLDLRQYLRLEDHVLDVNLTPNRGDCFSVFGIAREVAAGQGRGPLDEAIEGIKASSKRTFPVKVAAGAACPRFARRVVTGLNASARTPDWLRERLRRAGLRSIHPVVDVTNYVLMEYGQPLHAYRLDKLKGSITVRQADRGETLTLLNDATVELDASTLVIADDSGAIGLAGIMGGLSTAVDVGTDEILLESAFFSPAALQGQARRYGLHTDASLRFERGVDPQGQERALERATRLLLDICGGSAGPVEVADDTAQLPQPPSIVLRPDRIAARLGVAIPDGEVARILRLLGMRTEPQAGGWRVMPPSCRFDIAIEEDLIEEIGRLHGYDRIPARPAVAELRPGRATESAVPSERLGDLLVARGYAEVVCFGFTSSAAQESVLAGDGGVRLANPLSQDLDALRSSLWPGLLQAARFNFSRQVTRCRLFEQGTVFTADDGRVEESTQVAGLVAGSRMPLHWEGGAAAADFFDVKGDVDALLSLWREREALRYVTSTHASLNPGRSAAILLGDRAVGWLGELHPRLQAEFEFKGPVVLFAIDPGIIGPARAPRFAAYSRFPSVRRDLAVIVDEAVVADDLTKAIAEVLGERLQQQEIFDVYRGKGVDKGRKSVGIGLILQDASRTLTDEESDDMIQKVVRRLEHEHGAKIRK